MRVLCIVLFMLMATLINGGANSTHLSNKYDVSNSQLLCYSALDKSAIVKCNGACIQKSILSRYKIDSEYTMDYHYRVGCESKSFEETIKTLKCDSTKAERSEYTIDYMIRGDPIRNARLFVRKKCCFYSKCNDPMIHGRRYWFKNPQSMLTVMRQKFDSLHFLTHLVYLLLTSLLMYGVITSLVNWWNKKKKEKEDSKQNCKELEADLILVSAFQDKTIVETGIEVTGRLTVRETAHLLAQLPDSDKLKFSKSKSTSSTEESTKELKTGKVLAMVESEALIGARTPKQIFIKPPLKTKASGWGHNLWNTVRTINSPNNLLYRMIEHGPYQYPFTALELLSLFEETAFRMADEPSLLQIDAEIIVIGDIRGRYVDLHRWLQLTGWPPKNRILFLGGILENDEPGSVECIALICSLKCAFPKHVFILRGEPETVPFKMSERIHPIITRAVQSCIKRMCSHMPFAAIIGKSILAVYSGFSPMIREKAHVHNLFRPVTFENMNDVERHIIFNQPSNQVNMYRPNPNGQGDWFGKEAVKRACRAMKCNVMIRGQSHVPYGYLPYWNNRIINLWSAPGYGSNYGATLSISSDLTITPILMEKQAN